MATNKAPWSYNIGGASQPLVFPGKVQAGSTAAIKRGELCTFDETSGYWIPANAIADQRYSLAIANEEQKADGLERYMEFIALRPEDVFEFDLDAAAAVELGDGLELTAGNSQQLTRNVDGFAVAFVVGDQNYPETGTTLRSTGKARVVFNPIHSYWMQRVMKGNLMKVITSAGNITPKIEDCGALLVITAAGTVTAPNAILPVGWNIKIFVAVDGNVDFDPKPDTAGVYVAGALQADGKYIRCADIGDFLHVVWDGTNWIAYASISGADGDISVEG